MKRSLSFWSFAGFVFVSVVGTLLHFLYDWFGQSAVVGVFSAVNESIWEHMKLLFVSLMLFALIERRFLGADRENFWCVKLLGTLAGLLAIPLLYYAYTGAFGVSADWFNIAIFFIAAALVFWLEARLLREGYACRMSPKLAIAALLAIAVLFVVFTFRPPHLPLFRDPLDGTYGIQ